MAVTQCICRQQTFSQLKELANREHLSLAQLRERTGCGCACRICEPYLVLMLKTGQTEFRVLSKLAVRRILCEAKSDLAAPLPKPIPEPAPINRETPS